jgi:hypothetical protein
MLNCTLLCTFIDLVKQSCDVARIFEIENVIGFISVLYKLSVQMEGVLIDPWFRVQPLTKSAIICSYTQQWGVLLW